MALIARRVHVALVHFAKLIPRVIALILVEFIKATDQPAVRSIHALRAEPVVTPVAVVV